MRGILHTAFSNAFDIFLAWGVVHYAFTFARIIVEKWRKDKFTDVTLFEQLISYMLCLLISGLLATAIYFIRGSIIDRDAVYSLTAFFILFIPSIIGVLIVYYGEWYPENKF